MDTTSNNKRIAKNTFYLYVRMAVMLVISLFTARIVFNTLGVNDYGLYNIVGSIIVFFSFLNNGLGNATRRYITAEIATGTGESRKTVFNTAFVSHVLIAIIILLIAETIGLWVVNNVLNIDSERMFAANVVYQLSVFSALFGIILSPYTSAILAYERMSIYAYFTIIDVVTKLLIIFLVQVLVGDKLVIYAILILFVQLINFAIYYFYCTRKFEMCKWKTVRDRGLIIKMFTYTSWSLLGQGAVVATNQGVALLINIFYNVAVNASLGISNSISHMVNDFVVNFQKAFNPQITKYYVSGETGELNKLVWRGSRYSSYLILIFLLPVCFEADDLIQLWLGNYPQYSAEFSILAMISIYFEAITAPLWMVLCSDANIKKYQIVVSSIFLLNILFSWIFLAIGFPPYTVFAVRIFVNILLIIARLLFVKARVDSFQINIWIYDVFVKSVIIIIPGIILGFVLRNIDYSFPIVRLLVVGGSTLILTSIAIFSWGMDMNERQFILLSLKNKISHYVKK